MGLQVSLLKAVMRDAKKVFNFQECLLSQNEMRKGKKTSHFCYLLRSLNEKCKNSTYIGYTVNPKRRIRHHNREVLQHILASL